MIYLRSYNLAFIKIPKNASTAISKTILESSILSTKDVVTYTTYKDSFITQNCATTSDLAHITIDEAIKLQLVPSNVDSFCIIRNPVERLLSLFMYRCRQGLHTLSISNFHSLVLNGRGTIIDHSWQNLRQTDFINSNTELLLYETIADELPVFWQTRFNQPLKQLEYVNKSSNSYTKDLVSHFYTKPLINLVNTYYEKDVILYDKLRSTSTATKS